MTPRLLTVTVATAFLWLVWAADLVWPGSVSILGYGIVPRTSFGMRGIVVAPFIHASLQHLVANTIPFLILGGLVVLRGARTFAYVATISALIAGVGTWLFGTGNAQHVGASGVVFGFFGYLLVRTIFDRRLTSALVTLLVAALYGATMLSSLMPAQGVSWSGHLFGFLGGVTAARIGSPTSRSSSRFPPPPPRPRAGSGARSS
ncbi:MAG TPA: rhomboid family intramembrane serine protease [Thermoanaerobaculia bacterium]|jgi:membrane associated rhomboid family serine protease